MHAISVRQPWAEAIARFGKHVENRSRRPPAHLIGQRVAIHVSQASDGLQAYDAPVPAMDHWFHEAQAIYPKVPHAGRIIATARLVGVLHKSARPCEGRGTAASDADALTVQAAFKSPWFTGPVGWVLADVRELREPVGETREIGVNGNSEPIVQVSAIRGQVYPFALSPEVEAAVLAAEVQP